MMDEMIFGTYEFADGCVDEIRDVVNRGMDRAIRDFWEDVNSFVDIYDGKIAVRIYGPEIVDKDGSVSVLFKECDLLDEIERGLNRDPAFSASQREEKAENIKVMRRYAAAILASADRAEASIANKGE